MSSSDDMEDYDEDMTIHDIEYETYTQRSNHNVGELVDFPYLPISGNQDTRIHYYRNFLFVFVFGPPILKTRKVTTYRFSMQSKTWEVLQSNVMIQSNPKSITFNGSEVYVLHKKVSGFSLLKGELFEKEGNKEAVLWSPLSRSIDDQLGRIQLRSPYLEYHENRLFIMRNTDEPVNSISDQILELVDLQAPIESLERINWFPPSRKISKFVVYKNLIIYLGVDFDDRQVIPSDIFRKILCFDLERKEWIKVLASGDVPARRAGHSVQLFENYAVISGGFFFSDDERRFQITYDSVFSLDLNTFKWKLGSQRLRLPVFLHSTAMCNQGQMLIMGGYDCIINFKKHPRKQLQSVALPAI